MAKINPFTLQERMKNPGGFKAAYLKFLADNAAKVDVAKSIGELSIYDQQVVGAVTRASFFQGQFTVQRSNLQNSFTRPEGEHMIILGIRLLDGTNANIQETDWTTGLGVAANKNATFTLQSNGVTYLRNFPAADATDETTDDSRGTIWLTEPILWQGQTALAIDFQFPVAPAANVNLRVEVIGVGTLS